MGAVDKSAAAAATAVAGGNCPFADMLDAGVIFHLFVFRVRVAILR